ncbi:MAG: bifunctional 5,10-methylenetetrahydrofolate dehydrogenase/5,10-methenyltetrahydrofolate cyclohydrolase [Patescibacteria group bacterium]
MIVDGRKMASEVLARTKMRAEKLLRRPNLLVYVAPDETPATRSYLKIKARSAEEAGCDFEETRSLTFSSRADAVIVQLPLPSEVNTADVLNSIPLSQDADVLSRASREKFERGDADALLPPVVAAVRKILEFGNVEVKGKKAVVIGSGFLVGAPVATWLTQWGAEVEVVTTTSGDLSAALGNADIIVSGAGSPHLIKPEMLKEDVVLIDAGTSESGGTIAGDADPSCADKCAIFTPVPGGIGPIAVACLFDNAVTLAEREK